jgi:hypothetical protein
VRRDIPSGRRFNLNANLQPNWPEQPLFGRASNLLKNRHFTVFSAGVAKELMFTLL